MNNFVTLTDSLSLENLQLFVPRLNDSGFIVNSDTIGHASSVFSGFIGDRPMLPGFVFDSLFVIFVFCLVVTSIFIGLKSSAFIAIFRSNLSFKFGKRGIIKHQVTISEIWGKYYFAFQFILLMSVFVLTICVYHGQLVENSKYLVLFFLVTFVAITIFLVLKVLMYKILSFIFDCQLMQDWIIHYIWVIGMFGVIVYIPILLYIFTGGVSQFVYFLIITFFLAIKSKLTYHILNIFVIKKMGFVSYFVYLCGVEFVPYLICYKGLNLLINTVDRIVL